MSDNVFKKESSRANNFTSSCDSRDTDMGSLGFVLLHLTGTENLTAKSEGRIHTTPGLSPQA